MWWCCYRNVDLYVYGLRNLGLEQLRILIFNMEEKATSA